MTHNNKGFTLVELSIVLVIIGLTLGAILGVANTQLQAARTSSTKQKEEAIKLALVNFISRNNRLPCPAVATIAPGATGYGIEAANPGVCTGTTTTATVATGIVPWSSIGITDENASDGYYNRFTYQVTLEATNRTARTIAGLRGAISIHYSTPIAMGSPAAGNQANNCTPAGGTFNPCASVAVVVSHGSNGFGSYGSDGVQRVMPTGADETENTNNDSAFVIKDFSNDQANPFDDIVLALSSTDLLGPLTNHGSLDDYNSVLNRNFSEIRSAVASNAIANKVDILGVYTYPLPAALPALSPDTANDPWGNPYVYQRLTPSIDALSLGSTPAFTLTSRGPDGLTPTVDDLQQIVYVNNLQPALLK
ncbi:MAG TPA: prepilin-type N-terminal cleavage/methylation domain-containing protein [Methylotenera sp.]|nr:prepilin-type N-terminal cleavage/methylation domain-containing protein [Methylotenera sp.]